MSFLFLFLDGVGLGKPDPKTNPFAAAPMPILRALLDGRRMLLESPGWENPLVETESASLLALDACLGVPGLPQSATGQATLLTGVNVSAAVGYHYGPKPDAAVAAHLRNGNLFNSVRRKGGQAALLTAYPQRYFDAIHSGRRMFSAIPLAASSAGVPLLNQDDLLAGRAVSADFTGLGWRQHLGLQDTPLLTPYQAGAQLAHRAAAKDFAFFEYWLSDYAGHKQEMGPAVEILAALDLVLAGIVETGLGENGLVLLTSDHGNLEDLSTRRHTENPVPALLLGAPPARARFLAAMQSSARKRGDGSARLDLTDVASAVLASLGDFIYK